ncbi:MAG: PD40 domain-containing protein [Chloracidobacterium sp.]|nr:PD40 domain-containing protein [Chloracidobacterium sp.]
MGGSSRIETVDLPGGRIICITFTPDSAAVYFLASREGEAVNSLYRVGALGGVPTKVLTGISGPVSFSPDASEIAFVRQNRDNPQTQLLVTASDGSRERTLLIRDGTEQIEPNPAWSPDGKQIAVGMMSTEKSITVCSMIGIDLSDEAIKPLSDEKWDSCHRTAWMTDGSGLVFIGTKFQEAVSTRRDQVYYLPIASGRARRLTNSGNRHEPWSLGITRANEILALPINRVSQIWSLDMGADAQKAKQITTGQSDGRGGVEALLDGNIFYLARTGDGFGIFRTSGGDVRDSKAISADLTMEELRASPDGRFLVFAAKVGGYAHLFRVGPDGSDRRQLTFGETVEVDSTVSPDGRWIVYESHFFDGVKTLYSLQKIPAEGGDPVPLLNEFCLTPHFSYDGTMISCIDGELIRVISFEKGETLKTFKAVGIPVLNSGARWTPDGQYLAYRVLQTDVGNLWLQPINGGEAHALTNFSHGDIYNFTFTPDGSRIYLAHGNPVRNAVLIKNPN